ncbi:MAG: flagellar hook-basal body complex protein FliE [Salinarimonas sp.]
MMDAVASLQGASLSGAGLSGVAGAAATSARQATVTGFTPPTQRTDFSQVLSQVAMNGIDNVRAAEATSIKGIQGQASVQQVVEAVMSAEQSLNTAIAVRDKVVQAYQEISRMQI